MRSHKVAAALAALACTSAVEAINPFPHQHEDIIGWKALAQDQRAHSLEEHGTYFEDAAAAAAAADTYPDIHNGTFTQPLDHRTWGTSDQEFQQRYWYSLRHYKPSSQRKNKTVPLIVLEGGETDATARLAYLDHGIVDILAEAVGGIGVVLEHRYYGSSYPPRSSFHRPGTSWGLDELQWLTNWQAEQDSVNFVRNIKLAGVHEEINSRTSPVFTYGGSYAGARAAHLRLLYPGDFYGGIASSGVTAALEDFPEYMYGVARGNDVYAVQAIEAAVAAVDEIIAPEPHKGWRQDGVNERRQQALLAFAGVDGLSDPADFANLLMEPLGGYQSVNWVDALSPSYWAPFISAMASGPPKETLTSLQEQSRSLDLNLSDEALSLLHYINTTWVQPCRERKTADECFGSHNYTKFIENPKLTSGKAWMYQVCTTWGYFITSPKLSHESWHQFRPSSGPKLISSLLDHEYVSKLCRHGFPSTRTQSIPRHPNTHTVNRHGAFTLATPRLAFIDGQYDPWREATVHSESYNGGGRRANTVHEPFWLIPNATHHWDQNGLPYSRGGSTGAGHHRVVGNQPEERDEPEYIQRAHRVLVDAVSAWVDEWHRERHASVRA